MPPGVRGTSTGSSILVGSITARELAPALCPAWLFGSTCSRIVSRYSCSRSFVGRVSRFLAVRNSSPRHSFRRATASRAGKHRAAPVESCSPYTRPRTNSDRVVTLVPDGRPLMESGLRWQRGKEFCSIRVSSAEICAQHISFLDELRDHAPGPQSPDCISTGMVTQGSKAAHHCLLFPGDCRR